MNMPAQKEENVKNYTTHPVYLVLSLLGEKDPKKFYSMPHIRELVEGLTDWNGQVPAWLSRAAKLGWIECEKGEGLLMYRIPVKAAKPKTGGLFLGSNILRKLFPDTSRNTVRIWLQRNQDLTKTVNRVHGGGACLYLNSLNLNDLSAYLEIQPHSLDVAPYKYECASCSYSVADLFPRKGTRTLTCLYCQNLLTETQSGNSKKSENIKIATPKVQGGTKTTKVVEAIERLYGEGKRSLLRDIAEVVGFDVSGILTALYQQGRIDRYETNEGFMYVSLGSSWADPREKAKETEAAPVQEEQATTLGPKYQEALALVCQQYEAGQPTTAKALKAVSHRDYSGHLSNLYKKGLVDRYPNEQAIFVYIPVGTKKPVTRNVSPPAPAPTPAPAISLQLAVEYIQKHMLEEQQQVLQVGALKITQLYTCLSHCVGEDPKNTSLCENTENPVTTSISAVTCPDCMGTGVYAVAAKAIHIYTA